MFENADDLPFAASNDSDVIDTSVPPPKQPVGRRNVLREALPSLVENPVLPKTRAPLGEYGYGFVMNPSRKSALI